MIQPKIGLIGTGRMGMNHCRVLNSIHDVNFVGVYDTDKDRCQDVSSKYQVLCFESYDELIQAVDAIIIAAPTPVHYILAEQAILQHKHVLVEKPLVTSLEDAHNLAEIAKKNHVIVQVGHIERFNPAYQIVTDIIDSHDIMTIDAQRFGPRTCIKDTNVILDLMIHDIDLILNIVKSPLIDRYAEGIISFESGQIEVASAFLRFQNGVVAHIQANRLSHEKIRSLRISERSRILDVDLLKRTLHVRKNNGAPTIHDLHDCLKSDPLTHQINHFIQSIQYRTSPVIGISEAIKSLEVAIELTMQIDPEFQK